MKLTPIKTLVVYRDLWVRGGSKMTGTHLLDGGGMCCLGFASLATGVPAVDLKLAIRPSSTGYLMPGLVEYSSAAGSRKDTRLSNDAMEVNDIILITDEQREEALAAVFANAPDPIALTFEDTAPPELRAQYKAGLK